MHKVGNKIECNNMHGERIKRIKKVYCCYNKNCFLHYIVCCIEIDALFVGSNRQTR